MDFLKDVCGAMTAGAVLGAAIGVSIGKADEQLIGKEDAVIRSGAIGAIAGACSGLFRFLSDASGENDINDS